MHNQRSRVKSESKQTPATEDTSKTISGKEHRKEQVFEEDGQQRMSRYREMKSLSGSDVTLTSSENLCHKSN